MDRPKIIHKLFVKRPSNLYYFTDEWYENVVHVPLPVGISMMDQLIRYTAVNFHGIGGITFHDGEYSVFFFRNFRGLKTTKYYGHLISHRISPKNMEEFIILHTADTASQMYDALELCEKNLLYCFPDFQNMIINRSTRVKVGFVLDRGDVDNGLPPGVYVMKGVSLLDQVRMCAQIAKVSFAEMVDMIRLCSNSIHAKQLDELHLS